ncbi:OmpA family protein [Vibrio agarivorans]|uniref:OmpA family protein n=1 Tax=Vibrio agarivorans TaxID=153622 RepID=UPI00222E5775|nr:OmpA family protein [Vibrio agarivorans]MDN3660059.1 OmpA family protein [Vibrio agarivorans]
MKKIAILCAFALTGCGSFTSDPMYIGGNMLDTAPQNDLEVKHPEWGDPPRRLVATYSNVPAQPQASMPHALELETFLRQMGIQYRVIPGDYSLIQLEPVIQFDTDSSRIDAESRRWLDSLGRYLAGSPEIEVVIDGHTDNQGVSGYNDQLAQRRAESVEKALLGQKVEQQAIYTRAFGESMPRCSNASSAGKQCNRRVEIKFIYPNG